MFAELLVEFYLDDLDRRVTRGSRVADALRMASPIRSTPAAATAVDRPGVVHRLFSRVTAPARGEVA